MAFLAVHNIKENRMRFICFLIFLAYIPGGFAQGKLEVFRVTIGQTSEAELKTKYPNAFLLKTNNSLHGKIYEVPAGNLRLDSISKLLFFFHDGKISAIYCEMKKQDYRLILAFLSKRFNVTQKKNLIFAENIEFQSKNTVAFIHDPLIGWNFSTLFIEKDLLNYIVNKSLPGKAASKYYVYFYVTPIIFSGTQ